MQIKPHFYVLGGSFAFLWISCGLFRNNETSFGIAALVTCIGTAIIGALLWDKDNG